MLILRLEFCDPEEERRKIRDLRKKRDGWNFFENISDGFKMALMNVVTLVLVFAFARAVVGSCRRSAYWWRRDAFAEAKDA